MREKETRGERGVRGVRGEGGEQRSKDPSKDFSFNESSPQHQRENTHHATGTHLSMLLVQLFER